MALRFSKGTLKTKRCWSKACQIPKEKNFQSESLYPPNYNSSVGIKYILKYLSEKFYFHVFVGHLCVLFCQVSMQVFWPIFLPFFRSSSYILDTKSFVIHVAWGLRINPQNRIESSEIDPDKYGNLIYVRAGIAYQQRKNKLFRKNGSETIGYLYGEKWSLHSKWIRDLIVKSKLLRHFKNDM